jgi:hypothetical protein
MHWALATAEWDRATRSMLDGVALIERINAWPCSRFLTGHIST